MSVFRATTIDQLQGKLAKLFTPDGLASGLAFEPGASDIIISPFSKCGTTWMQQTVHGLRTRGSMDFAEITEVIPWIDAAADLGQDLNADQVATPRVFKSHLDWDRIPKGGRYICVLRDPMRALISMYKFFEGWLMEPGAIEFEEFAYKLYLARKAPAGYWHHLASWLEQRDNPQVLLLCYEQLQDSFPSQLQVIADFLEIPLDDELREIVQRQSSLAFMRSHDSHFDDNFLRDWRSEALAVPRDNSSSEVSSAESASDRPEPSEQLIADMQERWQLEVSPRVGFQDYPALLAWFEAQA